MYESYELVDSSVKCPYNENHRIARSRLQKHIVKCEKNYPSNYKAICPYNATHRLFKHEMMEHIVTCPMRRLIEPELYQRTGNRALMTNKLRFNISNLIQSNENWDEELEFNRAPDTKENVASDISERKIDSNELRAPYGFSQAMLIDMESVSNVEDMGSIISWMGMGRGRPMSSGRNMTHIIGLGRGKMD